MKESDYIKTWALYVVCATVGGFIAGAFAGGILGMVLGAAGMPVRTIRLLCGGAGFIVGLPISYLFFRLFVAHFIVRKFTQKTASDGLAAAPFGAQS